MSDRQLVTGVAFIDGVGVKDVHEIVEPTPDVIAEQWTPEIAAYLLAEIAVAGGKALEWLDGPHIEPLPEDQAMAQLEAAGVAQRLPGVG
jgi:hypothetical protein